MIEELRHQVQRLAARVAELESRVAQLEDAAQKPVVVNICAPPSTLGGDGGTP